MAGRHRSNRPITPISDYQGHHRAQQPPIKRSKLSALRDFSKSFSVITTHDIPVAPLDLWGRDD